MDYSVQKIALTWWTVFFVSLFLFGCKKSSSLSLPYYNTPAFDPVFISHQDEVQKQIPHKIEDFEFTDQHNNIVNQKTIEGKIHVANFIFTSCVSICPKMTNEMKRVSDAFGGDPEVVILSFSVTPWIDSTARLKEYAEEHGIHSPNWHLLTGSTSAIYELARKSYFAEEDIGFAKDSTEFLHTEHFLLVDRNKRIRGIYNGTLPLETKQLIKDIQQLRKE